MMYRIFAAAMAAGVLAAVLISAIQTFTTTPMILQAETFEVSAPAMGAMNHDHGGHATAWAPSAGGERFTATLVANCATGIAFALLLVIGLTFGERPADITKAMLLAGGGFAAFTLAPALGLPPELPGMPVADLTGRQIWWAITVALAVTGLACLAYGKPLGLKAMGILLLITPHVWGPPSVALHASLVPATLAAQFAATSIALSAVFWGLIGLFSALFYARFSAKS